jgi:hypothetical protein
MIFFLHNFFKLSRDFREGCDRASREHRGGSEGVSRDKPIGTPSMPSLNPLQCPLIPETGVCHDPLDWDKRKSKNEEAGSKYLGFFYSINSGINVRFARSEDLTVNGS